eukprot:CAMPEP_0170185544 /NCGR_PEP_ID=MMETSP0040_2-20121228/36829_1 /TAXON_ID=641309 /ORGANISM="Lotharella oceanica, Strain CCMP622" /LENGTH=63 /DNA_ID=CAMNT_0010431983 /DNA_START=15 /DNA_END=206 /DNA_ORIENTATION=-
MTIFAVILALFGATFLAYNHSGSRSDSTTRQLFDGRRVHLVLAADGGLSDGAAVAAVGPSINS